MTSHSIPFNSTPRSLQFVVWLYVLRALELKPPSSVLAGVGMAPSRDPYLRARVGGGGKPKHGDGRGCVAGMDRKDALIRTLNPQFYERIELATVLPGPSRVHVRCLDKARRRRRGGLRRSPARRVAVSRPACVWGREIEESGAGEGGGRCDDARAFDGVRESHHGARRLVSQPDSHCLLRIALVRFCVAYCGLPWLDSRRASALTRRGPRPERGGRLARR
jgi:hypothetical protein